MPEFDGTQDVWANTNKDRKKWLRGDPETGGWFKYNPATGEYDIPLEVNEHLHPTLGDISFTGSIAVGGVSGMDLDVSQKIEITRLKIEKGIITALEYET